MSLRQRLAGLFRRFPDLLIIPYRVYRLFQAKYTLGVVGVILNEDRQVLLVDHVFHARMTWGLPGGWVDGHEHPANAIRREMSEELGLDIDVTELILMDQDTERRWNHISFAFRCYPKNSVGELSHELLGYDWYDIDDLPRLHGFQYRAIQVALQQFDNRQQLSAEQTSQSLNEI